MKQLNLSIHLVFIFFSFSGFAQSISPAPGNSTVCPGERIIYTVNPNPGFSNCSSFTWSITNGSFVFGANPAVTIKTTTTVNVDVFWNDVASTGTLKVTSSCSEGALSVGPLSYAIRSLAGRTPANARANNLLPYCSILDISLAVDVMFLENTGGTTGVTQQRANGYEWVLPAGWSSSGSPGTVTTSSELINIYPDNGCRGGTVTVRAFMDCNSGRKYSSSASISVNRDGFSNVLPTPSGYTGPACGKISAVTFTAASFSCAQNYRWTYPLGWAGPGGATGSYTTTQNFITLTPSGSAADAGAIAVDINIGCATLSQVYNTPAYANPPLSSPNFTTTSINLLCSNASGTVSIDPISEAGTYTWYTSSSGTIYVNGSLHDISNPLTTSSTNITLSVPSLSASSYYNNQVFVKANRSNGCEGSITVVRGVWAGTPKPPGALDKGLSPICPGEIKTGQFSSPPQGFATLELINPHANFEIHGGYTYLTVEAFYPVAESTSFTHRQTNACGIQDVRYFVKVLDYSDTRCGGSGGVSTVQVYPNPTADEVTVTSDTGEEERQVTLLSDANEQLFQTRASTKEIKIPLSSFPAGIYFIQVESQSEGVVKKQLVIRR